MLTAWKLRVSLGAIRITSSYFMRHVAYHLELLIHIKSSVKYGHVYISEELSTYALQLMTALISTRG